MARDIRDLGKVKEDRVRDIYIYIYIFQTVLIKPSENYRRF
jgi:hypothetical protein